MSLSHDKPLVQTLLTHWLAAVFLFTYTGKLMGQLWRRSHRSSSCSWRVAGLNTCSVLFSHCVLGKDSHLP